MSVRVYNTLSRTVEDFTPLEDGKVKVYICGMTVYDYMHIGHARTYLAFDAILRYLKYRGFDVTYVQNITDVDDKIIKRAKERGRDPLDLSREFSEICRKDQESLGLVSADEYPRVSENIDDIIEAVKTLIENGSAYEVDGSVYFDVFGFPDYGKLSNQNPEQLNQHRVEPNQNKKNPLDFALWKKTGEDELGFDSPWGRGRPGWHIECSVMSKKFLGEQFDIHGGALDLIFPHHENEIAQSESLSGKKPFVKYWLHTGFLQSTGEKMSKSLGNIIPVREFLKEFSKEAFRLFVLQTHYRSPIDYGRESIAAAQNAFDRLQNFRRELDDGSKNASEGGRKAKDAAEKLEKDFIEFMDDDFNTPQALGAIFDYVRKLNTLLSGGGESKESLSQALEVFDELLGVLGFGFSDSAVELSETEKKLISEREKYRTEKNWGQADRIRDELSKLGITLVDKADGTTVVERAGGGG